MSATPPTPTNGASLPPQPHSPTASEAKSDASLVTARPAQRDEAEALFRSIDFDTKGFIYKDALIQSLDDVGLRMDDPRLKEVSQRLKEVKKKDEIRLDGFHYLISPAFVLISRALTGDLIIPEWKQFCKQITDIYEKTAEDTSGKVADYIPQLARVNPEQYAVAVCTIDGQRFALGDSDVEYCVQSCSKPVSYMLALEEHGEAAVHKHVGREPSGVRFNALALNEVGLPHNPLINSGAIMCSSLLKPKLPMAERFGHVLGMWKRLAGYLHVGYNNTVYLSERATADRNFALAYFMAAEKAFPKNTDLVKTLELYFQMCSIETSAQTMSVIASTLANGGVCPLTEEKVADPRVVRNCLSVMYSCGMYDFSGEFAFTIGLPAKSGVSGCIMLIVPNVMGIAIWSPRLDKIGNSVRGLAFCKELVSVYNFHKFDDVLTTSKKDPSRTGRDAQLKQMISFLYAAAEGDLVQMRQLMARRIDVNMTDYDGRTALHLAASEGHFHVVKFLCEHGASVSPVDRWGGTPLADAKQQSHKDVIDYLERLASAAQAPPASDH